MTLMRRREFVGGLAAAALLASQAGAAETRPSPGGEGAPLRERAARKGLFYGVATKTRLFSDVPFLEAVAREAGMLVPEWETKRNAIEKVRGVLDFSAAERLFAFTREHGMAFRGHTLLWHQSNPDWLEGALTESPDERLLTDYVTAVAAHFRGRVHSWDVINEAVNPASGREDGLRPTAWLKAFGPRYLDLAFHAARAGDPDVLLVYNDYDLEWALPPYEARRRAVLRMLEGLKARGVPVGGLGLQAHLRAFGRTFDATILKGFLAEVAAMGLKILITELDVADRGGPSDPARRDQAVADMAERFLDVALDQRETVGVLTWGLTDRYTWLASREWSRWPDGQPPRVLPLDADLRRKPMWEALARAFDGAPVRKPA